MRSDGILSFTENDETNTLIGWLSQNCGNYTSVKTIKSFLFCHRNNSLKKVFILWISGHFVMYKFSLNSLLGSNDKDCFSCTSEKTTHKSVIRAFSCEEILCCILESSKANWCLWNGKQKKSCVASIESEESIISESFLGKPNQTEGIFLFFKLHNSL